MHLLYSFIILFMAVSISVGGNITFFASNFSISDFVCMVDEKVQIKNCQSVCTPVEGVTTATLHILLQNEVNGNPIMDVILT